jgi:hypothetical protein
MRSSRMDRRLEFFCGVRLLLGEDGVEREEVMGKADSHVACLLLLEQLFWARGWRCRAMDKELRI